MTKGFTLIEAVIAVAILAIILASVIPAFVNYLNINTASEVRTGAVAVAQRLLDDLRAVSAWPPSGTVTTVATGQRAYSAILTHSQFCYGGRCFSGARRVRVEVSYAGRTYYQVETVFTQLD
ncbi:MAG: prepilin-type N-terminal cleavage/methylation domain-containing protein [Truepera sp.]|jgi:prepilin-type N-terminal cleavage/methylation domain-containing protein|nr:prepilin-type N-terminal cleavage/methylation domain-containing protein [Truepera sp.]